MANKAVTTAPSKSGIGIGTVCFIVFVIMKLVKIAPIASWSWLKVIFFTSGYRLYSCSPDFAYQSYRAGNYVACYQIPKIIFT